MTRLLHALALACSLLHHEPHPHARHTAPAEVHQPRRRSEVL